MRHPSEPVQFILGMGIGAAFVVLWYVIDRGVDWLMPKKDGDPRP